MESGELTAERGGSPKLLRGIWMISAGVFFVLALLWAGSKLRHTGDTWVGLAAGQNICEHGFSDFPLQDKWTLLYQHKTWWNQNWLTHVAYWLVYHYLSPGSLVLLKLVLVILTGLVLWNSCEVLSRHRAISLLSASAGLLILSEFIDIRPNHVGILCSGAMFWLLIRLKYGSRWAIAGVPLLLLVWGNAHGSFLFGYVLIAMFVATEGMQRLMNRPAVLATWANLIWLCGVTALSAVALVLISPYGLENFRHPLLIMVSKDKETFQRVMEWMPAWTDMQNWGKPEAHFLWFPSRPWVGGYWWLAGFSVLIWIAVVPLWLMRLQATPQRKPEENEPAVFDLTEWAFVAAAIYFSLTSRRFVPLFVLFTMPVTAKMLVVLLRSLSAQPGGVLRLSSGYQKLVLVVATVLSIATSVLIASIGFIWRDAHLAGYDINLWRAYFPMNTSQPYDDYLFERHAGRSQDLVEMVEFAKDAGLSGPVFNEWTWGGYLMFEAPEFELFIDGRSQALFPAEHFQNYWAMMGGLIQRETERIAPGSFPMKFDAALREIGVNMVMVKRRPREGNTIINPLLDTGLWEPIFESEHGEGAMLLVRTGSGVPNIEAALQRFYAGDLKWPDTRLGWRVRGYAMQRAPNPDWRGSLEALKKSLEMGPDNWVYDRLILRAYNELNDRDGAIEFLTNELDRLSKAKGSNEVERNSIQICLLTVRRALTDLRAHEGAPVVETQPVENLMPPAPVSP